MSHPSQIFHAATAGYVFALLFSAISVGPINLTILNEGSQRGFKWALLIGLGASVMEVIKTRVPADFVAMNNRALDIGLVLGANR